MKWGGPSCSAEEELAASTNRMQDVMKKEEMKVAVNTSVKRR